MKNWLSMILCSILLFTLSPMAGAQTQDLVENTLEKKYVTSGKVTSVDVTASKVTLETRGMILVLTVDTNTKLRISDVKSPDLTDIWVGDKISAEYASEPAGNIAKKLTITKQKGSLKGTVELIDTTTRTIKITGNLLVVSPKAEIQLANSNGTFADILLGDKIEAKGFIKDGVLQAYSLKITRESTEFKGKIDSINQANKSIVIAGKTVLVTDKTEIKNATRRLKFEDLAVGASVEAKAWKKNETEWVAIEIKVKKEEDSGYEGMIKGKINEVNVVDRYIIIEGKKVFITDKTILVDRRGKTLPLANVKAGEIAEAKGTWKDSMLTATRVKVEQNNDGGAAEGEVEGKIDAIDYASKTLLIKGKLVRATERTVIVDDNENEISFDSLRLGWEVEAKGYWVDGVLVASKIEVED